METDLDQISMLAQREIEARIAEPLIRAYVEEIGEEKALAVAKKVITKLARDQGAFLAKKVGGNSMAHLDELDKIFSSDNSQDEEVLKRTSTESISKVTRCVYADMYKKLGMVDLGYVLSCGRDFEMFKGFNPLMNLKRTKTIMQGDAYCDFHITLGDAKTDND